MFYNGEKARAAVEEMHLSDAFMNEDSSGRYEWTATVLNLNHEDNQGILGNCGMLREYTDFVSRMQELRKSMEREDAVDKAVREWIQRGGELAEILLEHRSEVVEMLLTEFNEEEFVNAMREEGRREGIQEGRREGIMESARRMIQKGKLSMVDIAESLDLSLETVERIAGEISIGQGL